MRRMRRRTNAVTTSGRLFCGTNGCASFLELDPETGHGDLPHLRVRPPGQLTQGHLAALGPASRDDRAGGRPAGHPARVTTAAPPDRDRLARLMADEMTTFATAHPRSAALHERARALAPRGRAHALDGQVGGPVPALRRVGRGRPFPLRRRPRLRRLLPRRHRRDGRPRPASDDGRRRTRRCGAASPTCSRPRMRPGSARS